MCMLPGTVSCTATGGRELIIISFSNFSFLLVNHLFTDINILIHDQGINRIRIIKSKVYIVQVAKIYVSDKRVCGECSLL